MEEYLNVIHFCFYKLYYKMHLFVNRVNPFRLINKLPFQKRRYEELGIDFDKDINKAFGDRNYGLSIMVAGGVLLGLIGIFIFSLLVIFDFINGYASIVHIIVCSGLSGALCYSYIFKDSKYLTYFDRFEKWSKSEKRKYYLLSLVSTLTVLLFFYFGLWFSKT